MSIMLIIFIGIIVILNKFTPNKTFSETENRVLEQRPHFSFESLFNGTFTSDYEKYISDQFTLRDFWIGVKSDIDRTMGKNESNGVYLGKDNYLLQEFKKPSEDDFQERIDAINEFAKSTPGLNKYFMLAPTSFKVFSDKLPKYAAQADELEYINKIKTSIDKSIKFADVYNTLNSKKSEYIYYRTDHHWTTKGAFYAYTKLAEYMNFAPAAESSFKIKNITSDFYGSLYSEGGFRHIKPDSIELYIPKKSSICEVKYSDDDKTENSLYAMGNLTKKDKYAVFLNGNHPLIKITTKGSPENKLLIIKDSYANSLIPFLTEDYDEIYVVDPRYYSDDLKALIVSNNIKNILMLYNVNTFFEDSSITNIADMDPIEPEKTEPAAASVSSTDSASSNFKELFASDIFMGDSISEGLSFYDYLDEKNVDAKKGMSIVNAKNEISSVAKLKPKNIYILYGINDMNDTVSSKWFVDQYRGFIDNLKAQIPQANIYIQSILPVDSSEEKKNPHLNNKHISECNAALMDMAKQEKVSFINIASLINQNDKSLYEGDGTHFKAEFYPKWLKYVAENSK